VVALFGLLGLVTLRVNSAGCHSTPVNGSGGMPNMWPIFDGDSNLELVNSVENGTLFKVVVPNGGNDSTFWVAHVWGTPYQMGYAQGKVYGETLATFINHVWNFLKSEVESDLPPSFPPWLQNWIATMGLDAALDLTYDLSKDYTGPYFFEEMQGMADASGVPYETILRVHMLAGLTQGKCSMFGTWGEAVDPMSPAKLLQLRALDWDMDAPFRNQSSITVYHPNPNSGNGHPFINIAFPGFIGGLTGMSATQLGISEIGVSYPDPTFGKESRVGVPFIFTLRDILQFDMTVDDASNRLINQKRTCDLILGVGDGKLGEFRGYEYSSSVLNIFDDENMMPYNQTWHPRITDVVYWGMDWICPYFNTLLSEQINKYYGKITPALAIANITAVEQSGDNHLAFYDLTGMQVYVAFAAAPNVGGPVEAYNRQFTQFDVNSLLNYQQQ